MKLSFFWKTAAFLFLLTAFCLPTLAAGKMEVDLGKEVTLSVSEVKPATEYKWILKKDDEILSTQSGTYFKYVFNQQGEYNINVTGNGKDKVQNSSIWVLAGDKYPRPDFGEGDNQEEVPEDKVSYYTLPAAGSDGKIHVVGDSKVYFNINVTRDDILEYRIDRNIFLDTDSNGTSNDDIDNAGHESYLRAGAYEAEYKADESAKVIAEITLVTRMGEKIKEQIEIVFDPAPRKNGDPVAILDVTPAPSQRDQLVHLPQDADSAKVAFYMKRSEGGIVEYRIDRNIFQDSDGDGDPANDIDNLNHTSFKTGDVWETEYDNTDAQIIAQLIVVSKEGKGSRVQRGIVFTDETLTLDDVKDGIYLTSDKDFVLKGDPITFSVEGLALNLANYHFYWDFDGDGEVDKEIQADNTVQQIYEDPGVYNVKVRVVDQNDHSADFTIETLVKDKTATIADFDFEISDEEKGNTVTFSDKSNASMNLSNQELDYTWNFGDTNEQGYNLQKDQIGIASPTYTYYDKGTYLVTLTIVDADQKTDQKTAEIIIKKSIPLPNDAVDEESKDIVDSGVVNEGGNIFLTLVKILLITLIILVLLVVTGLLGFLAFIKVQHPDLTFEELIDELKLKLLTLIGAHDLADDHHAAHSQGMPETQAGGAIIPPESHFDSSAHKENEFDGHQEQEEAPIEGEVMEPQTPEPPQPPQEEASTPETPPTSTEQAPKPTQSSESQTPETPAYDPQTPPADTPKPPEQEETVHPEGKEELNKEDGPVPDWLK